VACIGREKAALLAKQYAVETVPYPLRSIMVAERCLQIARSYQAGYSVTELAAMHNVTPRTVNRCLNRVTNRDLTVYSLPHPPPGLVTPDGGGMRVGRNTPIKG
jgi:hypothetical protein